MFWTSGPSFVLGTSNIGTNYGDFGIGTAVDTFAFGNTKGSNFNLLNGLAQTAYGLWIWFSGGNFTALAERFMVDIKFDYGAGAGNAGSTWTTVIANLYANSPAFSTGAVGCNYFFPIIIPKGTAIGCAAQTNDSSGYTGLRVVVGVPSFTKRPEWQYGTRVQTIGATTGSTSGVAVTPGTNAKGSWSATLGTLDRNAWWFQLGIGSNDTTMTANGYLFDLSAGPSQEKMCIYDMYYNVVGTTEQAGKSFGQHPTQRVIPSGSDLYVRGAALDVAPDSSMTAVAYAVS